MSGNTPLKSRQDRLELSNSLSPTEVRNQFNLSSLFEPSAKPPKKTQQGLKGLRDRFLQDLHPHIRASLQKKQQHTFLKKNFSLEDTKVLDEFNQKHAQILKGFNLDGFMTNVETAEYQVSELERALSQRKKEKLNADHNAYLKITEKDEISKALVYVDRFPLLAFRKRVVSYWERVRGICFKVV